MPLYEYRCEACSHPFEVIQKFSDAPINTCPKCGAGPIVKLLSSPAIQFKGSGFYINDYARKDSGKKDSDNKESGSKDSGSKDSGSKDSGKSTTPSTTTSTDSSSSTPKPTPAKSDSK